ncbi:MAG: peptidyl-prolyl cis-trans isomerase [Treponema sp.]|nr:peptidyl-prolyl cis-trans isomerase [Treponema sp.]MBP5753688.1 peptidyl-prolyl cis-trans isomerase [Treponema sp.]
MAELDVKKKGKNNAKLGAIIVLILSALVFIPVGASSIFDSIKAKRQEPPVFGKYKGKKIEYKAGTEYATAVTNLAQQFQQMGYDVNNLSNTILEQAFEGYVQNLFYRDQLDKAGFAVSNEAINREMVPYFTDANGNFSKKIYNEADQSSKDNLRTSLEKQLMQDRYSQDLFGTDYGEDKRYLGLKVSSKENQFVSKMNSEKHSFLVTSFDTNNFPREEAKGFIRDNSELFEKYDLSAVTLTSQSELQALAKQIQANEITFEDAVSQKSEKLFTGDDGKLSSPYYFQLKVTLANQDDLSKLTSLSTGDYSEVLQTVRGWTLFKCNGPKTAVNMDDEATLDAALTYINTNEHGYIENYYIGLANKFITDASSMPDGYLERTDVNEAVPVDENSPAIARRIAEGDPAIVKISGFENACLKHGISSDEALAFPINYGNNGLLTTMPDAGGVLTSLPSSEKALQTLFSLKNNQISAPFVLGDKVVVAKCIGIQTDEAIEIPSYASSSYYDDLQNSSQAIMNSPDLENNFYNALIEMNLR